MRDHATEFLVDAFPRSVANSEQSSQQTPNVVWKQDVRIGFFCMVSVKVSTQCFVPLPPPTPDPQTAGSEAKMLPTPEREALGGGGRGVGGRDDTTKIQ